MKKLAIILMLAIAGSIGRTSAQVVLSDKTGWHKIGEKTLEYASTRTEMSVMGADRFASLRFRVKDAPVTFESVDIYFEDGGTQHMNLNETVAAAPEAKGMDAEKSQVQSGTVGISKEIKLTDAERSIDKIVFTYKKIMDTGDNKAVTGSEKKETGDKVVTDKYGDNKNVSGTKAKRPVVEIWGMKTNLDKDVDMDREPL